MGSYEKGSFKGSMTFSQIPFGRNSKKRTFDQLTKVIPASPKCLSTYCCGFDCVGKMSVGPMFFEQKAQRPFKMIPSYVRCSTFWATKNRSSFAGFQRHKTFFSSSLTLRKNKLVCLLTSFYLGQANICEKDQNLPQKEGPKGCSTQEPYSQILD